ncbi:MAG: hydrolase [Chloroflexi bacterium]|nr:hydrolase [Chloroflexota bacterium]
MTRVRMALVQVAWLGSREAMMEQYRRLVRQAADRGAVLVGLPEFSLIPYFPGRRDRAGFAWAEPLPGGVSERFFGELARECRVTLIGSLYEQAADGRYFDTATIHTPDGALAGITRKVHIPSGEGYHETDFFEGGVEYPVHDLGVLKLAAPTCYDQWFPELARIYALNGAQLIFYPTAIGGEPTAPDVDSREAWQTAMRGHAVANGVFVGAANRVGVENGIPFYGSSFVCDPMGTILAQAGHDTTEVITADLDLEVLARWRSLFPLLHQRKPQLYGRILDTWQGDDRPEWLNDE